MLACLRPARRAGVRPAIFLLFVAVCATLLSGCGSSDEPRQAIASGSWYASEPWPHDGQPFESEHFVVYSDAASGSARRELSQIAERALTTTLDSFQVRWDDFGLRAYQPKLDIYAYHDPYPQNWGARAYSGGVIIWSLDHPQRSHDRANYTRVFTHELTHVIAYLLMGHGPGQGHGLLPDMWFSEGLAEVESGGTSGGAVTDLARLHELTAEYGQSNPIAVHSEPTRWCTGDEARRADQVGIGVNGCKDPAAFFAYYYPMFQLGVGYLVDPNGLGKSLPDAAGILTDLSEGASFSGAFEARMGISLADYEARFFPRMEAYLPERAAVSPAAPSSVDSSPAGTAAVAALIAGVAGFVTWRLARQHRPSDASRAPDA